MLNISLRTAAVLGALLLSACNASVPPGLTPEQQATYDVTEVKVTMTDDALVWWGDGDRAVGITLADGETPENQARLRQYTGEQIDSMISPRIEGVLQGT